MILENTGIKTNTYFIPPFTLNEGEIVLIHLPNDERFYNIEMELVSIFTGKTKSENLKINRPLTFVPHIFESHFRRRFYPMTVSKYLKKMSVQDNNFANKIYEHKFITKRTKVQALSGTSRKLLSLYTTLSQTKDIVFDVAGQDPSGVNETFEIVKSNVEKGGSAILIDCYKPREDGYLKYIELELIN